MHCDEPDPGEFLPLHPLSFRVLMSVAERPSYGTEIVRTIDDAEGDTTLYPANLYRRIRDLLEDGLLRECEGPEGADGRWSRAAVWTLVAFDTLPGALREWTAVVHEKMGGGTTMGMITKDIRHAIRGLRSTPTATLIAVPTLTLGIGANTATFSVVDGVMLEPLDFEDPERIVSVWPRANFNVSLVREFAEGAPALAIVAGFGTWTAVLTGAGDPVEIDVVRVSPFYFEILGNGPEPGRTLRRGDELPDASGVVVLSHGLWTSHFGADPEIVGRAIQLTVDRHQSHLVFGVMPAGFDPPDASAAWTPLVEEPGLSVAEDASGYVNTRISRLAAGATIEQASAQVRTRSRSWRGSEGPGLSAPHALRHDRQQQRGVLQRPDVLRVPGPEEEHLTLLDLELLVPHPVAEPALEGLKRHRRGSVMGADLDALGQEGEGQTQGALFDQGTAGPATPLVGVVRPELGDLCAQVEGQILAGECSADGRHVNLLDLGNCLDHACCKMGSVADVRQRKGERAQCHARYRCTMHGPCMPTKTISLRIEAHERLRRARKRPR